MALYQSIIQLNVALMNLKCNPCAQKGFSKEIEHYCASVKLSVNFLNNADKISGIHAARYRLKSVACMYTGILTDRCRTDGQTADPPF